MKKYESKKVITLRKTTKLQRVLHDLDGKPRSFMRSKLKVFRDELYVKIAGNS